MNNCSFLIRNASVVLPDGIAEVSVLVKGDKIVDVDAALTISADENIDARGLVLIPGVIDDQVHFREPGLTHKEDLSHASRACAKGGVTTFLEMPNTLPTTTSQSALNAKLDLARRKSLVNYGFYIGATPNNLAELQAAKRTPGIKIFIGSSTGDLLVDDQEILEQIFAETTLPICAHCEDESTVRNNAARFKGGDTVDIHSRIRDRQAAVTATSRAIDLALRHQHRFHVLHVSTEDEIPLIAQAQGLVTAEVCPHHLFFNVDDYAQLGSMIKVNPSIKTARDNEQLWQALLNGTVQILATDHAPHTSKEKALPYPACPSGLPGVENSLALMLDQVAKQKCSLEQVVRWMCSGPALVWDLVGKGRIEVGFDADLTLVDLNLTQTVRNETQQTKCKWSPWVNQSLRGWPVRTWVMGREVFRLEADLVPRFADAAHGREAIYDHSRGGYFNSVPGFE